MAVDPVTILIGIGVTVVGGIIGLVSNNSARRQAILDNIKARDEYYEQDMANWRSTVDKAEAEHERVFGSAKTQAEKVAIAQLGDAARLKGKFRLQAQEFAFNVTDRAARQVVGGRDIRGFAGSGALMSSGSVLARLAMTRSVGAEGVRRLEAQADFAERRGELAAALTRESVIEPFLVLPSEPIKMPVPGEDSVTPASVASVGGDGGDGETAEVLYDPEGNVETQTSREFRLSRELSEKESKDLSAYWASKNQYRSQKRDKESELGRELTTQEKVNLQRKTKVEPEDLWRAKQLQSAILHRYPDTSAKGIGEPPPTGLEKFHRDVSSTLTGLMSAISGGLIKQTKPPPHERTYVHQIQDPAEEWRNYDPLMFDPTEGGNQPGYRPVSESTRIRRELGFVDADSASRGLGLLGRLGARDIKRIHERLTEGGGRWTEGGALGHKTSDTYTDWDVIAAAEELGIDILGKGEKFDRQLENKARYQLAKEGKISRSFADEDQARSMGWIQPDPDVPGYWVLASTLDPDDPLHPDAIIATKQADTAWNIEQARKAEEIAILGYDPDAVTFRGGIPGTIVDVPAAEGAVTSIHPTGLLPSLDIGMAGEIATAEALFEAQHRPVIVREQQLAIADDLASVMQDEVMAEIELEYWHPEGFGSVMTLSELVTAPTPDEERREREGYVDGGNPPRPILSPQPVLPVKETEKPKLKPIEKIESVLKPYTPTSFQPLAGSREFDELAGVSKPKPETKQTPSTESFFAVDYLSKKLSTASWTPQVFQEYIPGSDPYDYS